MGCNCSAAPAALDTGSIEGQFNTGKLENINDDQGRKARHKRLLRQEILDAARDIFVKEGYSRLSMRRVADKIDYSPTAIYLHFRDKQELVFSLCEESFDWSRPNALR